MPNDGTKTGEEVEVTLTQAALNDLNQAARLKGQRQAIKTFLDDLGFESEDALKGALAERSELDATREQAQSLESQLNQQTSQYKASILERQVRASLDPFLEAAHDDVISHVRSKAEDLEFDAEAFSYKGVDDLLKELAEQKTHWTTAGQGTSFSSPAAPPPSGSTVPKLTDVQNRRVRVNF